MRKKKSNKKLIVVYVGKAKNLSTIKKHPLKSRCLNNLTT